MILQNIRKLYPITKWHIPETCSEKLLQETAYKDKGGLLTNMLTPCNGALAKLAAIYSRNIPYFIKLNVHYHNHTSLPLVLVLIKINTDLTLFSLSHILILSTQLCWTSQVIPSLFTHPQCDQPSMI